MFDLETAIVQWRKKLAGRRSIQDGDLAELEDHLRDKIDSLVRQGRAEEEAFRTAASEFDEADRLDADYYRAHARRPGRRPPWQAARFAPAMFGNAVKTALRHGRRHRGYAVLTIGSLALALTVALLTIVWAGYENSYDRFHRNADSIYRFFYAEKRSGGMQTTTSVPEALRFVIKKDFSEVVRATPLLKVQSGNRFESATLVDFKSSVAFVGPDFLAMFDFPLVKGDPRTALDNPKSILLTESAAGRFFGTDDPMGKTILAQKSKTPTVVTGVLKDIPETSHLDFDFLMGISDLKFLYSGYDPRPDDWSGLSADLYVQLAPGADAGALADRVTRLANERNPTQKATLTLQPLRDIHLQSEVSFNVGLSNRRQDSLTAVQVRIFLVVALVVLIIGGINYVNFAAARALKRIKEVAVRKVNGAGRADIIRQFLAESVLLAFLSLAAAVALAAGIGLPVLHRLTGLSLDLALLDIGWIALAMAVLTLFVGLLAGLYPALLVSSITPAGALRNSLRRGRPAGRAIRRLLVGIQVVGSTALIIVLAVLVLQMRYVDRKDLGYKRNGILIVRNDIARDRIPALKNDLLAHPAVLGAATGFLPIMAENGHFIQDENVLFWEGKPADARIRMDWHFVDEDYLETYGLELVQGRFFSMEFPADKDNFVLNESAVKAMGLKDPIGKFFRTQWRAGSREGRIIGVVRDFHVGTLRAEIRPMYFVYGSGFLAVRIDPRRTAAAVEHIEKVMKSYQPDRPLDFIFLNDYLGRLYEGDRRNARIVSVFSLISVAISCLGLFGLVSFLAERRTKEVGVRKVLGASVGRIIVLMSREFTILVVIAVGAAFPVGYAVASRWLSGFAYRIRLEWWIFAAAGAVVLALTLVAMSLRTIHAARANPVESLRYE
jgi:putative ABC transport system permease protein